MDNRVFAVRCRDYDRAEERLQALIGRMGGMARFAAAGERIVLKTNLLLAAGPERAVTTHPHIVAAAGRMVKAAGAAPLVADSPGSGYPYTEKVLKRIYRASGLEAACTPAGIALNLDTRFEPLSFPAGKLVKRFEVIRPVSRADGVLNLCKLKTHLFMHMTGAVKNSFGVIPGRAKPGYHAKLKDTGRFADMLLDLSALVAPRLSVMDAVLAMEGEGPNAGTPRPVGLLLAAVNPLALDVVAGAIMGIDSHRNPVLEAARKRGLGPTRIEEIDLVGVDKAALRIPDFKLPATLCLEAGFGRLAWWQHLLTPLFKTGMSVRPVIVKKNCVGCGACRDACPMAAIALNGQGPAEIDDGQCVRCYCCHEMCCHDAVQLRKSLLYRLVNR